MKGRGSIVEAEGHDPTIELSITGTGTCARYRELIPLFDKAEGDAYNLVRMAAGEEYNTAFIPIYSQTKVRAAALHGEKKVSSPRSSWCVVGRWYVCGVGGLIIGPLDSQ